MMIKTHTRARSTGWSCWKRVAPRRVLLTELVTTPILKCVRISLNHPLWTLLHTLDFSMANKHIDKPVARRSRKAFSLQHCRPRCRCRCRPRRSPLVIVHIMCSRDIGQIFVCHPPTGSIPVYIYSGSLAPQGQYQRVPANHIAPKFPI